MWVFYGIYPKVVIPVIKVGLGVSRLAHKVQSNGNQTMFASLNELEKLSHKMIDFSSRKKV